MKTTRWCSHNAMFSDNENSNININKETINDIYFAIEDVKDAMVQYYWCYLLQNNYQFYGYLGTPLSHSLSFLFYSYYSMLLGLLEILCTFFLQVFTLLCLQETLPLDSIYFLRFFLTVARHILSDNSLFFFPCCTSSVSSAFQGILVFSDLQFYLWSSFVFCPISWYLLSSIDSIPGCSILFSSLVLSTLSMSNMPVLILLDWAIYSKSSSKETSYPVHTLGSFIAFVDLISFIDFVLYTPNTIVFKWKH